MTRIFAFVIPALTISAFAQVQRIEVKPTPAVGKHCHVVRFPAPWQVRHCFEGFPAALSHLDEDGAYEFRRDGPLSNHLLIGASTRVIGDRCDALNWFRIDLSQPLAPPRSVKSDAWEAADVIPLR